jgi:hypothetical protein
LGIDTAVSTKDNDNRESKEPDYDEGKDGIEEEQDEGTRQLREGTNKVF